MRDNGLQRPGSESSASPQHMDQPVIQRARNELPPVMSPQQDAQQFGGMPDGRGRDLEDMKQHEIFRGIVPEIRRLGPFLGVIERVEVAAVERGDDRIAETWKQRAQAERKLSASLQEIVRKGREILPIDPYNQFGIRARAPVPVGSKPRFVGKTEGGAVVERYEREASFSDGPKKRFLKEQRVRIGDQGKASDPGHEFIQNSRAPARHILERSAHAAPMRVNA